MSKDNGKKERVRVTVTLDREDVEALESERYRLRMEGYGRGVADISALVREAIKERYGDAKKKVQTA